MALPNVERHVEKALRDFEGDGLLLETDARLPSLAALVAGGPVRGSWWGHPSGRAIFATGQALSARPEVLLARLISGKATWIHRRLWPALLAVARAREPWQMEGLSKEASSLLVTVDRDGAAAGGGAVARELEARLLARGEQIHTEGGRHAKRLESWGSWADRVAAPAPLASPAEGRRELEAVLAALNARCGGRGRLPWQAPGRRFRAG